MEADPSRIQRMCPSQTRRVTRTDQSWIQDWKTKRHVDASTAEPCDARATLTARLLLADLRIARACTAGWFDGRRGPLRFVKIPAELLRARDELPPVSVTAMFTSRFGGEERFEGGEDSPPSCRRSPSGDSLTDVAAASVSPPKDGPASSFSSSAAVSSSSSSPPWR